MVLISTEKPLGSNTNYRQVVSMLFCWITTTIETLETLAGFELKTYDCIKERLSYLFTSSSWILLIYGSVILLDEINIQEVIQNLEFGKEPIMFDEHFK